MKTELTVILVLTLVAFICFLWYLKKSATAGRFFTLRKSKSHSGGVIVQRLDENVQFTVFRPNIIKPVEWYTLLAFAHLSERRPSAPDDEPDPIKEVHWQARQTLGASLSQYDNVKQDARQP